MSNGPKMIVRKLFFFDWCWECPVCHYGENIPWREAGSFREAWECAEAHIAAHVAAGKRLEWIPV